MSTRNCICINCGEAIDQLYKKYSATVLKLTECRRCSLIADRYIEYDTAIIIIDLILLKKKAYRHVLFNTEYSIHWKLWIILALMEAYADWSIQSSSYFFEEDEKKQSILETFVSEDVEYYKSVLKVIIRNITFFLVAYLMTLFYTFNNRNRYSKEMFIEIWKCVTLSSFGIFLALPSLVWDKYSSQDYHYAFVSLYMTLSQLIAYTVVCKCSKLWSIAVILTSYFCKIYCLEVLKLEF